MRILLAHGFHLEHDENERKIMKIYPPLGLLYVSAVLKEAGHDVEVFDGTFRTPAEFEDTLSRVKPEAIGLYTMVITREWVCGLIPRIRSQGYAVICGGPDSTADPEAYLQAGALAVVRGEGERTAVELFGHLEREGFDGDLSGIAGLCLLGDDGSVVKTAERDRIKDLDEVPHPDRTAIDLGLYADAWRAHHGYSQVSLMTSRGCPYKCTWCARVIFGRSVRQRSADNVIEELEMIRSTYSPDMLWFADDVLTLNKKWTLEMMRKMKERGLTTPFECLSRVDRVDEEILTALKEAGCKRIWYGAESGSDKVVAAMEKGFTVEKAKESIALTMQTGIEVGLFILMGYPGETLRDLLKTMGMIRELKPHFCGGAVAFPIKGTTFYEEVQHLLPEEYAWNRRNENRLSFRGRYPKSFYWFASRFLHNWSSFFSIRSRELSLPRRLAHAAKFAVAGAGTIGVGSTYELMQKLRLVPDVHR